MFPEGKTLAIIGNAPSVRQQRLGGHIDGHDVVVRFNECALDGFEEYVGRRTDILVSNPYAETRQRPLLDGRSAKVVLILTPQTRRGDAAEFARWAGDNKVLFSYTPALIGVPDADHTSALTTGTYAIHLLWRLLRPKSVFLSGFTMFAEPGSSHYWQGGAPPGLKAHDLKREASIFTSIINSIRAQVAITKDVFDVFGRTNAAPGKHVHLLHVGYNPASSPMKVPL